MEYTEKADQTIRDMHSHVYRLGAVYGENSTEFSTASASLMRIMGMLHDFKDREGTVISESPMELGIDLKDSMYIGVCWHRNRDSKYHNLPEPGKWSTHS